MPSNDSPAFDVLSAYGDEMVTYYARAFACPTPAILATAVRNDTVNAMRARQTERGESQAPEAERAPAPKVRVQELSEAERAREFAEYVTMEPMPDGVRGYPQGAVWLGRAYLALRDSRDTDLARARVEGIREGLTRYADSLGPAINARDVAERMSVLAFRDREYPAPKPAECRKRIGDVHGIPMYADPSAPKDRIIFAYEGEVVASCAIHPDSPVLRKNAATHTEGQ